MNESRIEQLLTKLAITIEEIDFLSSKLKKYLKSYEQFNNPKQMQGDSQIINSINISDEFNVYKHNHTERSELLDTKVNGGKETDLRKYYSDIKVDSSGNKIEESNTKELKPHELVTEHTEEKKTSKVLIYDSFYQFKNHLDDLIYLLELYFNKKHKKNHVNIQVEKRYLDLESEIYLTYRKIDELFSRVSLINDTCIQEISNKQKRHLDSIVNLIHLL